MNIRLFRQTDADAVVKLWQLCGLTRPWNNPQLDIERKGALNDNGFVVMEKNGNIIGSVMFGYDGHRGSVYYLAVHPDYQRQQLGHQLMTYVEKQLTDQGCPKINLMVRSDNQQVRAFYQSLGYETNDVTVSGKRLTRDD
ncbi:MAG: GNAT family acetyltransferase [Gammaproteobacteria bacterium]|nr:MAG: GNAT family acetyltransferase [Gammaproteobacteria bacterium]